MNNFLEFLDERGRAVLVQRGEIAAVRDADPSVAYWRCVMILRNGETIPLQTPFADAVKRLREGDS